MLETVANFKGLARDLFPRRAAFGSLVELPAIVASPASAHVS
jgi:hypothetical protein